MTDFRIEIEPVEQMRDIFNEGATQLEDTLSELRNIVNMASEGQAFIGDGGNAFVDALLNVLCPRVSTMTEKFREIASDLQGVLDIASNKDMNAATRFRD